MAFDSLEIHDLSGASLILPALQSAGLDLAGAARALTSDGVYPGLQAHDLARLLAKVYLPASADLRSALAAAQRYSQADIDAAIAAVFPLPPSPVDVSPSGLRAYWTFDEGSGMTAKDSSGNGYHAALESPPIWTTDHAPTVLDNTHALLFDAQDTYAVAPSDASPVGSFTASVWIKPTARSDAWGGAGFIFCSGREVDHAGTEGFRSGVGLHLLGDPARRGDQVPRAFVWTPPDTLVQVIGKPMAPNTWHHIAVRFDGSSLQVYQDGDLAGGTPSSSLAVTAARDRLYIGRIIKRFNWDYNFDGVIDDLRIYDRVLTDAEIRLLARQP